MKQFNNDEVRRGDRLLDCERAREILQSGEYGVLSMVEERDGEVAAYGIPINYAWDGSDYIYFHCALQGHKLESMDANSNVSLCVVGCTDVISHKFTTGYESIIIRGEIVQNLSPEERMKALELVLDKYSPQDKEVGMKYAAKSFDRTEILRLRIDTISGKSKKVTR